MGIALRVLIVLVLLPIAGFCAFGFLASFESPSYMGWRIGYTVVGLMCLAGIAWAVFAKSARR